VGPNKRLVANLRESSGEIHKVLQKRSCTPESRLLYRALSRFAPREELPSEEGEEQNEERKLERIFMLGPLKRNYTYLGHRGSVRTAALARTQEWTPKTVLFVARRFEHSCQICKQFYERSAHSRPRCCSFRRPGHAPL